MHEIVICGPESTGKSTLAAYLANYYKAEWIKEYAREYVNGLNRDYSYEDVEKIADEQVKQFKAAKDINKKFIFYDTGLIITKIWFLEAFGKYPEPLDKKILEHKPALYLLCYYDLEWKFDLLRENGSKEQRKYLFNRYLEEIKKTGCKYQIIRGFKQERYKLAIETIDKTF